MFRIWRSPYSDYHSPLLPVTSLQNEIMQLDDKNYSPAILQEIAAAGFNGVWVHALLQELVRHSDFPEFGTHAELLQERLSAFIRRAGKFGIKVYLQMQPPRAVSGCEKDFWQNHADTAGAVEILDWEDARVPTPFISLCTSHEKVRNYLFDAMAEMGRIFPELGGYIIISASEYPAHCCTRPASRQSEVCPRCSARGPAAVISDVLNTLYSGMRSTSKTQHLIAWNWGWADQCRDQDILCRLDPGIIPMGDFERGGRMTLLGKEDHPVEEYALCYPGPSGRFLDLWSCALGKNMQCGVKFQLETTHENGSVVSLPVIPNIFSRAQWFKKNSPAGFLGCWNFGNFAGINTAAFNFFLGKNCSDIPEKAMAEFAVSRYPGCVGEMAAEGWNKFAEAMKNYPHTGKFLYYAPTSWALGYMVKRGALSGKAGATWLKNGERGDDLALSLEGPFSLDEIITGIEKLCYLWENGLTCLGEAEIPDSHPDYGNALLCGACFNSLLYMLKLYRLKVQNGHVPEDLFRELSHLELINVERALPFAEADNRQGYHSEAQQYNFSPEMLRQKIGMLQKELADPI